MHNEPSARGLVVLFPEAEYFQIKPQSFTGNFLLRIINISNIALTCIALHSVTAEGHL